MKKMMMMLLLVIIVVENNMFYPHTHFDNFIPLKFKPISISSN